jgi:hypothetical protein
VFRPFMHAVYAFSSLPQTDEAILTQRVKWSSADIPSVTAQREILLVSAGGLRNPLGIPLGTGLLGLADRKTVFSRVSSPRLRCTRVILLRDNALRRSVSCRRLSGIPSFAASQLTCAITCFSLTPTLGNSRAFTREATDNGAIARLISARKSAASSARLRFSRRAIKVPSARYS